MLFLRWRAPGRAATWVLVGALTGFACSDEKGYQPLVLGSDDVAVDPAGGTGNGGAVEFGGTGAPSAGGTQGGTGGRSGGTGGGGSGGGGPGGTQPDLPPVSGSCSGWSSRYWDCCKPHCAWRANVSGTPTRQCGANDQVLGGDPDTQQSACNGGPAYMCHGMAPWVSGEKRRPELRVRRHHQQRQRSAGAATAWSSTAARTAAPTPGPRPSPASR
jgi:hypothetical protein